MDQDDTLKALEGFNAQRFVPRDRDEQNEQNSDDSDLFLKLAREESAAAVRPANRRVSTVHALPVGRHASLHPDCANTPPSRNRRK